jgi:hypothetical protein
MLEKARREVANHCNFCLAIMASGHGVHHTSYTVRNKPEKLDGKDEASLD